MIAAMFGAGTSAPLALILLALGACSSETEVASGRAPEGAPNVLLISIDSLRPDHLGCYGYGRDTSPFIDSLAAEGLLFENGLSTTSWTLPAHAALFTGLRDSVHGLYDNGRRLNDGHQTLAEVLWAGGYQTAGFYGGPYLHPAFGLGQGFETYVNCMSQPELGDEAVRLGAMQHDSSAHGDVTGPRTRAAVAQWAVGATQDARPYFLFVHLWDVHYDFQAPEEYVRLFDDDYGGQIDGRLMSNESIRSDMPGRDLEHLLALYDAEIRFTDDVLRGMFDDLESQGLLDNTLVILTADHGEEFFEHRQKGHNKSLYDEVLRIPMIVRWPGVVLPGTRSDLQVQLIDWMPTVMQASGVSHAAAVQGRDLGAVLRGGTLPERDALAELLIDGQSFRALRSNARKVIETSRAASAFYADLEVHPREDVWLRANAQNTPEEEALRILGQRDLEAAIQRSMAFQGALDAGELELGDDLDQRLRALGYLGDDER